jgi:MoaA/NifB/PqqE/SkfB family radical SAM enzyme
MTKDQMKATIDKLYRWLGSFQLTFTGGEPFSNPFLPEIIRHAADLGIQTHVNTNAYLINQDLAAEIVDSGINTIQISIDGLGETHDQNRGRKGAFTRAESAIKLLTNGRENHRKDLWINTNTVVMSTNLKELESLVRWGQDIGLNGMTFQPLWENFSVKKHVPEWYKKSALWPKKEQSKQAFKTLINLKKNGALIENTLGQLREYLEYYESPIKYGKHHPCFVGVKNFSIFTNGDVRLCFFFDPVGNILKEDPDTIWNGPRAQKERERINQCKRGCKILLCNSNLKASDIVEKTLSRGKRIISNFSLT